MFPFFLWEKRLRSLRLFSYFPIRQCSPTIYLTTPQPQKHFFSIKKILILLCRLSSSTSRFYHILMPQTNLLCMVPHGLCFREFLIIWALVIFSLPSFSSSYSLLFSILAALILFGSYQIISRAFFFLP